MAKNYEIDMSQGALIGKIIRFSIPLMLTSVLQLLFNAADTVVVGRFAGSESLAAVGSTGALINLIVNLFMALMFLLGSLIPGVWGESYVEGSEQIINFALDHTFRGTWYVLLGSSVAFIVSSVVNNELNWLVGKLAKGKSNFGAFALRSYVSTFIAQFIDNLVFALIVSHNFFGWTMTQCVMCAVTGAVVELLCEIIFSPIGYRVANRWKEKNVGANYITYIKEIGGRI